MLEHALAPQKLYKYRFWAIFSTIPSSKYTNYKVDNVTFNAFSLHLDSDFSLKLRIHLGTFIYFLLFFQLALAAMDILLDCHV